MVGRVDQRFAGIKRRERRGIRTAIRIFRIGIGVREPNTQTAVEAGIGIEFQPSAACFTGRDQLTSCLRAGVKDENVALIDVEIGDGRGTLNAGKYRCQVNLDTRLERSRFVGIE